MKNIRLELTHDEQVFLVQLLDLYLRTKGLEAFSNVSHFKDKLESASKDLEVGVEN